MEHMTEEQAHREFGDRIADALSAGGFVEVTDDWDRCPQCKSDATVRLDTVLAGGWDEQAWQCVECGAKWWDTDLGDD